MSTPSSFLQLKISQASKNIKTQVQNNFTPNKSFPSKWCTHLSDRKNCNILLQRKWINGWDSKDRYTSRYDYNSIYIKLYSNNPFISKPTSNSKETQKKRYNINLLLIQTSNSNSAPKPSNGNISASTSSLSLHNRPQINKKTVDQVQTTKLSSHHSRLNTTNPSNGNISMLNNSSNNESTARFTTLGSTTKLYKIFVHSNSNFTLKKIQKNRSANNRLPTRTSRANDTPNRSNGKKYVPVYISVNKSIAWIPIIGIHAILFTISTNNLNVDNNIYTSSQSTSKR